MYRTSKQKTPPRTGKKRKNTKSRNKYLPFIAAGSLALIGGGGLLLYLDFKDTEQKSPNPTPTALVQKKTTLRPMPVAPVAPVAVQIAAPITQKKTTPPLVTAPMPASVALPTPVPVSVVVPVAQHINNRSHILCIDGDGSDYFDDILQMISHEPGLIMDLNDNLDGSEQIMRSNLSSILNGDCDLDDYLRRSIFDRYKKDIDCTDPTTLFDIFFNLVKDLHISELFVFGFKAKSNFCKCDEVGASTEIKQLCAKFYKEGEDKDNNTGIRILPRYDSSMSGKHNATLSYICQSRVDYTYGDEDSFLHHKEFLDPPELILVIQTPGQPQMSEFKINIDNEQIITYNIVFTIIRHNYTLDGIDKYVWFSIVCGKYIYDGGEVSKNYMRGKFGGLNLNTSNSTMYYLCKKQQIN